METYLEARLRTIQDLTQALSYELEADSIEPWKVNKLITITQLLEEVITG